VRAPTPSEVGGHLPRSMSSASMILRASRDQHASLILHYQSNGHDLDSFQADRAVYRYRPAPRAS
jgi:hypothetical protein